jgi:hypothetical protein
MLGAPSEVYSGLSQSSCNVVLLHLSEPSQGWAQLSTVGTHWLTCVSWTFLSSLAHSTPSLCFIKYSLELPRPFSESALGEPKWEPK